MTLIDEVIKFRDLENQPDPLKATWYLAASAAFAGAGEAANIVPLYRIVTAGLPLETAKLVQRKFKEAILKSTIFVGVPRTAAASGALYRDLKDEEIDHYGPRYESYDDPKEQERRELRGKAFFDVLWTPTGAERVRATLKKYHPDSSDDGTNLLNQKLLYEYWGAEDRILNNVETELVAVASLVTMNCPDQLKWHLRGAIRHGGTREEAQFAYDLGMTVAKAAGCRLGKMPDIEDLDFEDTRFQ